MKKLLISITIILGSIVSINAQTTILFQNFETSKTVIPAGWSQNVLSTSDPDNEGWDFNNTLPNTTNGPWAYIAAHTYYAFVDDWDYNLGDQDYDTLYLPSLNCSTSSHVFISFDALLWNYHPENPYSTGTLAFSTNGGTTWQTAIDLDSVTTGSYQWSDSSVFDISQYVANQSNVMLAFTYNNGYAAQNVPVGQVGQPGVCMLIDNVDVFTPLNYDLSTVSQTLRFLMQVGTPYTFSGSINNYGGDIITSMKMHYSVNGGAVQTQSISGISFEPLTNYDWSMNAIPFTPSAPGTYTIKYWADTLNGSGSNVDQNHANDTLSATFLAVASVTPRQALYEEFTGQSCVYCMLAAPNVDSVATTNASTSNIIRYHVPIPGRDFMYNETSTPVRFKETYYSVNSAPSGFLDGSSRYPSAYNYPYPAYRYSSTTVQADNALGSLFDITITSANYDAASDSFSISANITADVAFAAGLTAQVALTVDSITYKQDCSTDDPQESFAPPIGTSDSGYSLKGAADSYYPYVIKFSHVVEAMLPSSSGTSLGAFTAGQTQTISLKWEKNHPWGQYPKGSTAFGDSTEYDSSYTAHFVVFVQTNNAIASYGIPAKYVFQSANSSAIVTGMQEISSGIYFELYPNPTNNNTTLAFKLDKEQNVNVEVYNMLGEKAYSLNEGNMPVGIHTISINGSTLPNGIYFVRFNTDNASTTKKLIIQR